MREQCPTENAISPVEELIVQEYSHGNGREQGTRIDIRHIPLVCVVVRTSICDEENDVWESVDNRGLNEDLDHTSISAKGDSARDVDDPVDNEDCADAVGEHSHGVVDDNPVDGRERHETRGAGYKALRKGERPCNCCP